MESVKKYILDTRKKNCLDNDLEILKEKVMSKFRVSLPEDYLEFLKLSDGYLFQGCDEICGSDEIINSTNTLKDLLDSSDDSCLGDYIVIGTIFEHGYIVYIEKTHEYVFIEDVVYDFSNDINNLFRFSNIWDIFIYYDHHTGDDNFKDKYNKIFEKNIRKEKLELDNYDKKIKNRIDELDNDKNFIKLEINIDNKYLKVLEKEYKKDIKFLRMANYSNIKYYENEKYSLYINLDKDCIDIAVDDRVCSISFPNSDLSILDIIDKGKYFVLRVKKTSIEPIIIFKDNLDNQLIEEIKNKCSGFTFMGLFNKIFRK